MHGDRIFRCRCGAPIGRLGIHVLQVRGREDEEFCSKEHLNLACTQLAREQTNQKCREFGMVPYYAEARPFPGGGP